MNVTLTICEKCVLADCDIHHRSCRLRKTARLVYAQQRSGAPIDVTLHEAAREWQNESFIHWQAIKSERVHTPQVGA